MNVIKTISPEEDFNYYQCGIDKLRLSNLSVKSIDLKKLQEVQMSANNKAAIHLMEHSDPLEEFIWYMPGSNIGIKEITIHDNQIFSDLTIGYNVKSKYVYSRFTLCIALPGGVNLELMSYEEYDTAIQGALDYIKEEYGIELYDQGAKIDYIEIATTISLNEPFEKYIRPFELLLTLYPIHADKPHTIGSKGEETIVRGNKSIKAVFYNKKAQLRKKGYPSAENTPDLAKFEITLKNSRKVESVFGTSLWGALGQQEIVNYYKGEIEKICEKFDKWQKEKEDWLISAIKKLKKKHPTVWYHVLLENIINQETKNSKLFLLDELQIEQAIMKSPDLHWKRTVNTLHKNIGNIQDCCLVKGDFARTVEILETLQKSP